MEGAEFKKPPSQCAGVAVQLVPETGNSLTLSSAGMRYLSKIRFAAYAPKRNGAAEGLQCRFDNTEARPSNARIRTSLFSASVLVVDDKLILWPGRPISAKARSTPSALRFAAVLFKAVRAGVPDCGLTVTIETSRQVSGRGSANRGIERPLIRYVRPVEANDQAAGPSFAAMGSPEPWSRSVPVLAQKRGSPGLRRRVRHS